MALLRCFFSMGRNQKNKKNEKCYKRDFQTLLVQLRRRTTSSEACDLESTAFDVVVPYDMQKNSRCNVTIMSLECPKEIIVSEGLEREDEKKNSLSFQRKISNFEPEHSKAGLLDKEAKHFTVFGNQANNQLEDKNDEYNENSVDSNNVESLNKRNNSKNIDDQTWERIPEANSSFWPQNQWVALSAESSSSYARVDAWVKDLEILHSLPEDDFDDNNDRSIFFPPSPSSGADKSMARNTSQLTFHHDTNLSKEIFSANSVVQSLNPASTVAHISGIGIKAIPTISHLSNLRSVNLSSNLIAQISTGFLPKSIHILNLSRNKISSLEGLRELTRLRVLNLSYNRISRIGQGLSSCTLIKELHIVGNKISEVEGLHRLLKLTILDMSFNKITTTKALGQLAPNYHSLQALNLLGNPIQTNINDDQLRKAVIGLFPKLVYLNKQPLNLQRAWEISTNGVAKAVLGTMAEIKVKAKAKDR